MKTAGDLPTIAFETQQEWESWLDAHHADAEGVWVKIAKKTAGVPSITYAEAVEGALCYGWIDGQKAAYDDRYWLQRFTPRRPKSIWSRVNRENALALIAAGRMRPAGLEQINRAQHDGRWDAAYDSQRTITVPDDFRAALDAHPEARAFFDTLDGANRYAILWRIQTAKKSETRAARIATSIAMLSNHEKIHP